MAEWGPAFVVSFALTPLLGWQTLPPAIPPFGEFAMTADTVALPGLLAEIEEVVGRQAAMMIMADHGGARKKFPSPSHMEQNPDRYSNNWLVKSVGAEKALEIVRALFPAGGQIDIPSGMERLSAATRREFVQDNAGSLSVREIAMRLGMTERGVRMIKASLRGEGKII